MIEIEVKVQILNPVPLRQQFKLQGGVYKLSLIHEDTYYNLPIGLRNFKNTDEALRIRNSVEYNREKREIAKNSASYLTYKGKKIDNISKSRQEIEVKIDNVESMKEILSILGFRESITVKKERDLFEFEYEDKKIEALIDYLPVLNNYFLEVELTTESIEELSEKRRLLFKFLSLFGFSENDSIRKSYLELILEKMILN